MKGKFGVLALILLTAAVAAVATWWLVGDRSGRAMSPELVDVTLQPFTTNMRDGRVIQVSLVLRVAGPDTAQNLEQVRMADVRHAVYRVLRGLNAAEVAGSDGVDRLRQALVAQFQAEQALRDVPIQQVLVTDLIVQ